MSLITGVGLAAAAIIAAIDGDVLGLAAANTWTILGWAIASGILLVTALLPRVTREREVMAPASFADAPAPESIATTRPAEPVATPAGAGPATAVRSEPLRRTYQEPARSGQPTDAELAAAERAQAEQRARR